VFIPDNSNPMRGVFAAKTDDFRHVPRTNMLKPDQANAGDSVAVLQLERKARGNLSFHYLRIDPKVSKDSAPNRALNDGKSHD
jgi:hypothetical protein